MTTRAAVPVVRAEPGTMEAALRAQRAAGRKLLIPYLMGGMTGDWGQALAAGVAAGATRFFSPALLSDTWATPIASSSPARPIATTARTAFHFMPIPTDLAT